MRTHVALAGTVILLAASALAQDVKNTSCNFDDDNQITIQYNPAIREPLRFGKVWSPGATLYVQTPITVGSTPLALGAYSLHFIPDKKSWTMIINKNVTPGAAYNSAEDVARTQMEVGELPAPQKDLQLAFAHMAPKECNLRVYYQKTGAFGEFMRK